MKLLYRVVNTCLLVGLAACGKAPQVTVNNIPSTNDGVAFQGAYEISEGASFDLVIATGTTSATITTSALPTNAKLENGIFSFAPDYTQAGLYSVTFTITIGTNVTTQTIALRVQNVIRATAPTTPTAVVEGKSGTVNVASKDPGGTFVVYSVDSPYVTIDAVSGDITFAPDIRWLDDRPAQLIVNVTASGLEVDSGKNRITTTGVVFEIKEGTSFKNELVPLFALPLGAATPGPKHREGHNCVFCHDGAGGPGGMNFTTADSIYAELVARAVSMPTDGVTFSCSEQASSGVQRVVPGDLTKSLLYYKIAGVDATGAPMVPCGTQMPDGQPANYWTVRDLKAWYACTDDDCRTAQNCADNDAACKTNARLVKKLAAWIADGAPNN